MLRLLPFLRLRELRKKQSVIDYFTDTHFAGGNTPSNRLALAVDAAGEEDRI